MIVCRILRRLLLEREHGGVRVPRIEGGSQKAFMFCFVSFSVE